MGAGVGIRKALGIQFASKYANVLVQLLLTAVLARLLSPDEFGLVAIVTVFTSFFSIVADMGLAPAIVQFKDLDEDDLSGLLTFSALLGTVIACAFCAFAYFISWLYAEPELVPLCQLASVSILFSAANMVPNGLLLREKRFVAIGARLLVTTVVSGVVAVYLAFAGFGPYAIVAQSVVLSAGIFFWSLVASRVRVGNVHFLGPLRRVLSYSLYQTGFSVVNYFSRNLDNILIGKMLGTTSLGFYDKAYKLTTYPISFLASIVGSVLQPFLSKYQDDPEGMTEKWLSVAKALSLVAAPVAAMFFCAPEEVTLLFFGDQWTDSVPLFQVLSVSVYFQVVNNPSGAIFQSAGHTDYMFAHSLAATGMTTVLLLAGLATGSVMIAAAGISLAYCLHTISLMYFLLHKTLHTNPLMFVVNFLPEVAIAVIASCACLAIAPLCPDNLVLSLCIKLVVLLGVFAIGYLLFSQFRYLKILLKRQ